MDNNAIYLYYVTVHIVDYIFVCEPQTFERKEGLAQPSCVFFLLSLKAEYRRFVDYSKSQICYGRGSSYGFVNI